MIFFIEAYSKRNDILFVDEGVHYAIQKGIEASRSTIKWFRHNDINDLERLLAEQELMDKKNPKKAGTIRRFLIIEGLYLNYGDLCPLPRMVELKYKYKYRIFMDESVSFGTIGQTGRGVTEYFHIDRQKIDLISSTLEYSVGSIGGFAVGSSFVVDHQRLSAQGYCFSASLPPLLAAAAIEALNIMEEDNNSLFETLMDKSKYLHQKLLTIKGYLILGEEISPLKHLCLTNSLNKIGRLEEIVAFSQTRGITLTIARYLNDEHRLPQPSIRLILNVEMTDEELEFLCTVLQEALVKVTA
jgi:serine palmitoyltransferase